MGEAPRGLTAMQVEVLEECAGRREPRPWGAAVGACLGALRHMRLVDASGRPTVEGLAELDRRDAGERHAG